MMLLFMIILAYLQVSCSVIQSRYLPPSRLDSTTLSMRKPIIPTVCRNIKNTKGKFNINCFKEESPSQNQNEKPQKQKRKTKKFDKEKIKENFSKILASPECLEPKSFHVQLKQNETYSIPAVVQCSHFPIQQLHSFPGKCRLYLKLPNEMQLIGMSQYDLQTTSQDFYGDQESMLYVNYIENISKFEEHAKNDIPTLFPIHHLPDLKPIHGVGWAMMKAMFHVSRACPETNGRMGLISVVNANGFYERLGFKETEPESSIYILKRIRNQIWKFPSA